MALFQLPRKVYFQKDILSEASGLLEKEGISSILVITDKIIRNLVEDKLKSLTNFNIEVFDDVYPEPEVDYIERVSASFRGKKYDCLMAIGGGSVIDFSKALLVKLTYPDKDLRDVNPFEPFNFKMKLIAVPTTSGTGSDASFGIVLTDEERKLALANYDLVPEIIILDSSLTPRVKKIVVSTAVDALVHSFEAISANTSTEFTDALAERAIEIIFKNIQKSVEGDEEAKDRVHLAATMAGVAFSNSGTAMAHALGHSFGATFHITHGTSVGIFLPHVITFNSADPTTTRKYERISRTLGNSTVPELRKSIESLYYSIGQPVKIRELGISEEDYKERVEIMASKAMLDSELAFNPVSAGEEDLKKIFLEAY